MLTTYLPKNYDHIDSFPYDTFIKRPSSNTIRNIMIDNYPYIHGLYISTKLSYNSLKQIHLMILCNTKYLGYSSYECPYCHNMQTIKNSCKSRFCNKCSVKYSRARANHVSSIALDVPHRHIVFTIPKELRKLFAIDRNLLDLFFIASRNTINCMVNRGFLQKQLRRAKKSGKIISINGYNFKNEPNLNRFAAVATLHSFGRSLQWNPHIHMLVAEAYYDPKMDKIVKMNYFNFEALRKTFQHQLLSLLKPYLSKEELNFLYTDKDKGFYVYAKEDERLAEENSNSKNIEACIQYALRYTGRPPMAENRILNYNREDKMVTWYYNPHENEDEEIVVEDHAEDFINKLLIHIPRKNFKTIRYYGLYANGCSNLLNHAHYLLDNSTIKITKRNREKIRERLNEQLKYRRLSIDTFRRDPLKCNCGHIMKFVDYHKPFNKNGRVEVIDFGFRTASVNEMYQMSLSRRCSITVCPEWVWVLEELHFKIIDLNNLTKEINVQCPKCDNRMYPLVCFDD